MPDSLSVELHQLVRDELSGYEQLAKQLSEVCGADILAACEEVVETIRRKGRVFIAGNGGSASQADHIAAEFVGRFKRERSPYSAFSLVTSTATLTAIANDYGYEEVFARQLSAHGRTGDLIIALTTSGRSGSILRLLSEAHKMGVTAITLTGNQGEHIRPLSKVTVLVPSSETARIQEAHLVIGHLLAKTGEDEISHREN